MTLLFSQLPKTPWWGHGMDAYIGNWAMKKGAVPNQRQVKKEHHNLLKILQDTTNTKVLPFPEKLDSGKLKRHDFVFIRDLFISNKKGQAVISNFAVKDRQIEADTMEKILKNVGIKTYRLPKNAYAEGGEFYFLPKENILFAGVSRNNKKGAQEVANLLHMDDLFIIESPAYHLDTIFTVLINQRENLCGVLACQKLIHNWKGLAIFLDMRHIPLFNIEVIDTIGLKGHLGTMAVNCLSLPRILISGSRFFTRGIEGTIKTMGIRHIISPVTQFAFSGGGVHCLTSEL